MKLLSTIRERLGLKLFLSYLVIIIVGSIVLIGTAEFLAPAALNRHIARMQAVLGDDPGLAADLLENFNAAISEILTIAIIVGLLAAIAVSIFTARRIIGPIQMMMKASRNIAAGDYHERINVASDDELGALARSFNQMAEELEETEQRRLELIGDVAHELRTPLSSIRSTMEGLVDAVLPADPATFMGVQREVSRLQRLVHDLEELSRAESGQLPLEPQAVTPDEFIQPALERLENQYQDKGVDLKVYAASDLPNVWVDPGRITQVLLNLMGNALQYTPSGGQVAVRVWSVGGEIFIEVKDSGIGIPPDHLPHIFERFYRVDKSRSRAGGGSGIGLTIAKHLVEAHGGRIWATSPGPGQGSTFIFALPIPS
jgi:signal transduction histidine kinase